MRISQSSSLILATIASSTSLQAMAAPAASGDPTGGDINLRLRDDAVSGLTNTLTGFLPANPLKQRDNVDRRVTLDKRGLIDTLFPLLHGVPVAGDFVNGVIQSILDALGVQRKGAAAADNPLTEDQTAAVTKALQGLLGGALPATGSVLPSLGAAKFSAHDMLSANPVGAQAVPAPPSPPIALPGGISVPPLPVAPPSLPVPLPLNPLSPPLPANPPNTPVPVSPPAPPTPPSRPQGADAKAVSPSSSSAATPTQSSSTDQPPLFSSSAQAAAYEPTSSFSSFGPAPTSSGPSDPNNPTSPSGTDTPNGSSGNPYPEDF
ncbi:hypothetical protein ABKN59_003430 [Abortiporus biennis]